MRFMLYLVFWFKFKVGVDTDPSKSSDRDAFGTVSFNLSNVTAGFGVSRSIDW